MEENVNNTQEFKNEEYKQTLSVVDDINSTIQDDTAEAKSQEPVTNETLPTTTALTTNQKEALNNLPISEAIIVPEVDNNGTNLLKNLENGEHKVDPLPQECIVLSGRCDSTHPDNNGGLEQVDVSNNKCASPVFLGESNLETVQPNSPSVSNNSQTVDTNETAPKESNSLKIDIINDVPSENFEEGLSVETSIAIMHAGDPVNTVPLEESVQLTDVRLHEKIETELQLLTDPNACEQRDVQITPANSIKTSTDIVKIVLPAPEIVKHSNILAVKKPSQSQQEFRSKDDINGGINSDSFKYISHVSTEDIMKVYDKKINQMRKNQNKKPEHVMLNKILNSAAYTEDSSAELSGQDTAVMNNVQLLAILEGGNEQISIVTAPEVKHTFDSTKEMQTNKRKSQLALDPELEKSLALKQLKELPLMKRRTPQKKRAIIDVKIPKVVKKLSLVQRKTRILAKKDETLPVTTESSTNCDPLRADNTVQSYNKNKSDISFIMEEWTDDEAKEKVADEVECPEKTVNLVTKSSITSIPGKGENIAKIQEASPSPRRVSRVIKKKIIYDPDNPATFTYASSIIRKDLSPQDKSVENNLYSKPESQLSTAQKIKVIKAKIVKKNSSPSVEIDSTKAESHSKIVIAKKKQGNITSPFKKKKRSEVDRLLMDEGAVNMIYQLERSNNNVDVPEIALKPNKKSMISISKEKKSIVSKAKIVKKAVLIGLTNSNDPNKVFRARKDIKSSDKSFDGVQKVTGLRGSMQSPELSAARSGADESRIIRRHSSSSFSSGCLSPRPQSPTGDIFITPPKADRGHRLSATSLDTSMSLNNDSGIQSSTPIPHPTSKQKKLISGVIHTLKRKGRPIEINRMSMRHKRIQNTSNASDAVIAAMPNPLVNFSGYTQLSVEISDAVAHIIVKPTGNSEELYDLLVLRELAEVLKACSGMGAVLLTSASGALCCGLDLRSVMQPTLPQRKENAQSIIDAFRELVLALCSCRGAVVAGVGGPCAGPGVALLTLMDLSLASDRATFCAAPRSRRYLPAEGSSLLALSHALPQQLSRELVMCSRKLTASEALQRGLVARTLWPDRFLEELRSITADLAQHPPESFGVMKSILRRGETAALVTALEHEGELLLNFWCSDIGQDAIRDTHAYLSSTPHSSQ